jgi:hypothetical protein
MERITERQEVVKSIPRIFPADSPHRQSIHLAEDLSAEDKRLFLGACLRVLHRKLTRHCPISRQEIAELVAYADDEVAA